MKTPFLAISAGLLTCILGLSACSSSDATDAIEVKAGTPVVQALNKTVELTGVLAPAKTAVVYGKLSGQAEKIAADVGDVVHVGDVLMTIDAHELAAQLTAAKAAVATVQAQAAQALVGIDTAQTNYDQAKRYLDRINALQDQSSLSKNQLDDAKAKADLTQRALESAKLQYKTLSESSLRQAQAQVDVVQSNIDNSVLRSPIDGVVTNRNINTGELANPQTALFTIAEIDHLKVQGTVGQDVVGLLNEGQGAQVLVDGLANGPLSGVITQIGPVAASGGQYFPVVVTVGKPGKALAGMTARVALQVMAPEAPVLPMTAIATEQGRTWVFVIDQSQVKKTSVSLGLSDGRQVEVVQGLSASATVALTNVSLLHDGASVSVQP